MSEQAAPGFFQSLLSELKRRFPANDPMTDQLSEALITALSNKYDWQGPPTKAQEGPWASDNLPLLQSMQHTMDRVNRGELQANMTPIPSPLPGLGAGMSPFQAFWGRPQITGAGPFIGQGLKTVGMRPASAAVPQVLLNDPFAQTATMAPKIAGGLSGWWGRIPPDVQQRLLVGLGATGLGASTGLLGSALAGGGGPQARAAQPPIKAPFAEQRPTAQARDEYIEPEAEEILPIAERRLRGSKRR